MIKTGLGIANNSDLFAAGKQAAQEAVNNLGEKPDLFLVAAPFATEGDKILAGIVSDFSDIPLVGGTTGWGAITNKGIKEKEIVVLGIKLDKAEFRISYAENLSRDAARGGVALAEKILSGHKTPPCFLLIFVSGLGIAFDNFLASLKNVLGNKTNVLGGGTGDSMALKSGGSQFYNNRLLSDGAVGLGFWEPVQSIIKADHGWEPLGLEMKISKTEGTFVSEINGKPAVKIFEKYFNKEEVRDPDFFSPRGQGVLYPLGIISKESKKIIVRQIVGLGPKGELVFATNMPQGAIVRIMQAQTSKMIDLSGGLGRNLRDSLSGVPQVAFVFDCVTRKLLLAPDQQKEIDAFKTGLDKNIPIFGFFSYGEVCSEKKERTWFVHNETFAVGLLKE